MRDHWAELEQSVKLFGVSCDSVEKHQSFIDSQSLPFPLICDESRDLVRKFGVGMGLDLMKGKLMIAKRVTIVIAPSGEVEHVIDKVTVGTHGQDLLDLLEA